MIRKTDRNHAEIINELRKNKSISVFSTHTIGKGFPDIVVGYKGRNYLFEIKDELKTKSQTKLTQAEEKFFLHWQGQIDVITNHNQIINIINEQI